MRDDKPKPDTLTEREFDRAMGKEAIAKYPNMEDLRRGGSIRALLERLIKGEPLEKIEREVIAGLAVVGYVTGIMP